ncbi:MAG TPA: carbohydrate ABC transporter permease [Nocardioidaceae bacterium]|jgi:multiple sugar transport system permease protein
MKQRGLWRYIPLSLWAVFVLFPLYWVVITAFKDNSSIYGGARFLPFVDFTPSFSAWKSILGGDNSVLPQLAHSLIAVTLSTLIALFIGTLAAYGLARFDVRFAWMRAHDISFFIISQRMMPPVVVVMAFFILFRHLALLDTITGMTIVYIGYALPLVVWFMQNYFRQVPISLEEAALTDGASRFAIFWRISLPLTTPGLIATFLLAFSFSWNDFLFAVMLTETDATTIPIAIAQQQGQLGTAWWNICAISIISMAPMIAAAVFLQKRLVTGLLGGSER